MMFGKSKITGIWVLLLSLFLTASASNLRIDLAGLPDGAVCKTPEGAAARNLALGEKKLKSIQIPAGPEWKEFRLELSSPEEAEISVALRGSNGFWLLVDDLTMENAELRNGDFEKINRDNRFSAWSSRQENISQEPELIRSGRNCARINYQSRIRQNGIRIPANTPVVLCGYLRHEVPGEALKTAEAVPAAVIPEDANAVFDPKSFRNRPVIISVGRLELRPTFENCSVYLNLLPEERNRKLHVGFLCAPEGSGKFVPALPAVEVPQENAWRGSLLGLTENTSYDFKAEITGDGGYHDTVTGKFRTGNSRPSCQTIEVPGGVWTAGLTSGKPDCWNRYTSNGQTVTGDPAKGHSLLNLKDLEYIILDNIVFDADNMQNALSLENCRHIIIRNCDISRFGRKNGAPKYDVRDLYHGALYAPNGKRLYDDHGIRLQGTSDVLIEKCLIHDPAFSSQPWFFAHPAGPDCIRVSDCQNTVVRWNDFIGRDGARFIDHILGPPNGALRGGFARDADIYGNMFAFSNDDSVELEGGGMNVRCYANRIEGTLSGVSTGPCNLGPVYVYGNLFTNPGDENDRHSNALKNSSGVKIPYGKLFIMHNTVSDKWLPAYGVSMFAAIGEHFQPDRAKVFMRNNILRASSRTFHRVWHHYKTDCDGDLMEVTLPDGDPAKTDREEIAKSGLEKHGIFAKAVYENSDTGNYRLREGTPGWNAALPLPGAEISRHCGAFRGEPGEWLPRRPLDLTASATEFHWKKGDSSPRPLTVTPGKTLNGKFKIFRNDSFFTVTPESGAFTPGEAISFTVRLAPDAMPEERRCSGAFLIRMEDGLSLPVTVYADNRKPLAKLLSDTKRFVPGNRIRADRGAGEYAFEFDLPEKGVYFIYLKGNFTEADKNLKVMVTIGGKTVEKLLSAHYLPEEYRALSDFSARKKVQIQDFELPAGKGTIKLKLPGDKTELTGIILTREPCVLARNRGQNE